MMKSEGIRKAVSTTFNTLGSTTPALSKSLAPEVRIPNLDTIPQFIDMKTHDNPKVTIIIPVYNQYAYTMGCLDSINRHQSRTSFKIIIVDDVSTDETKEMEKHVRGIEVIRNEKNLGYLLNCNLAASRSDTEYILLLNNDTIVRDGWLDSLVDIMDSDSNIGLVGSKLLFPNGKLQEAGGILWSDGTGLNYGRNLPPYSHDFNYVKDADYVSAASILVRRSVFEEVGRYDERFVPAYCEDSDLAMSIRAHGYKVKFQPFSEVYHFEGVSHGKSMLSGIKRYKMANNEKFFLKWESVLKKEHSRNSSELFLAKDRSLGKRTIVFINHRMPMEVDNWSCSMYAYMRCLEENGANVKYLPFDYSSGTGFERQLQSCGVEVLYGFDESDRGHSWIRDNSNFIDIAVICSQEMVKYYCPSIRNRTSATIYHLPDEKVETTIPDGYIDGTIVVTSSHQSVGTEVSFPELCSCGATFEETYELLDNSFIDKMRTLLSTRFRC